HGALVGEMTRELTGIVRHLAEELRARRATPREIVDTVFDAFGPGGATRLVAWLELSGTPADLAPFHQAVGDLVNTLTGTVPGRRRIDSARVTMAVMLPALGHALVAGDMANELGITEDEVRAQVAATLATLLRLNRMTASRSRDNSPSEPRRPRRPVEA
ncbi:MAG: hypothetical protein WA906_07870, partial [Pacificimonas sp.]